MKNTSIFLSAAVILAVGVVGAYAVMNRDDSMMESDPIVQTEMVKDDAMMPAADTAMADTDNAMMEKAGTYSPFTPELLMSSANSRRVLFFYANWCPTCQPADASFSENVSQLPDDVTVIRVNYNDTETDQAEKDLAKKYGITYQHTYVQIDADGTEIAKWNGGGIDELLTKLK